MPNPLTPNYRRDRDPVDRPTTLPCVPSLLIYGADEPDVRRQGFEAARDALAPPSRVLCLNGAGHWPHLEAPETFVASVIAFLKDCPAPYGAEK